MITFTLMVIGYSLIWLGGMYFILQRFYIIRQRTEKTVHEYNEEYTFPVFRKLWVYTIILGLVVY
jgi:hypothetical protein